MHETTRALSQDCAAVVGSNAGSVVGIDAGRRTASTGTAWSEDTLVTALHVIADDEHIQVRLDDGRSLAGRLLGADPATDLALVGVPEAALTVPRWAELDGLAPGHLVMALARPGRAVRAHLGILSVLADAWDTPRGGRIDRYLEADLGGYPGFSGSPLLDLTGGVVGVNTSGLLRGATLTIPASTVRRVAQALREKGHIERGYFGIGCASVPLPAPLAQELSQPTALMVLSVEPGSPADTGGILLGDVLVALGGTAVPGVAQLHRLLGSERVGAPLVARLVRAGQVIEREVTVGARPA